MNDKNLQIPYGVFDFKRIRNDGYYYVDKTGYIPILEQAGSFLFFVRPRRFGKSLMASMLRCYYDLAVKFAKAKGLPLYLMLDECDNFTNAMLRAEGNEPYRGITHGSGFYREWFKSFKSSFDRIYMTGVSPVTMDDLTSGFNIATNISQDERFNAICLP